MPGAFKPRSKRKKPTARISDRVTEAESKKLAAKIKAAKKEKKSEP